MKLLTWNILKGGSRRRNSKIIGSLISHDPDVLVLTEFWEGPKGDYVKEHLRDAGWEHQYSSNPLPKENGLLIASKSSVSPQLSPLMPAERQRWVEVDVEGLHILAVHIPMGPPKLPFWATILERAEQLVTRPALIIGDLNTGLAHDAEGTPFLCTDSFERLLETGWHDAWRLKHGSHQEYSWYGTAKTPKGFRLDHALVSDPIQSHVNACFYSHQERVARYSDHSPLVVELGL